MKIRFITLCITVLFCSANYVFAHEGMDHDEMAEEKGLMTVEYQSEVINVGNAICPVSGEFISDIGDGKGVQIEHEGKIYNVCCKFCAKDFKKDPKKFIKIIENNLEEGKDPGRDYGSDLDDAGHDDNDHEESEHGEHDH